MPLANCRQRSDLVLGISLFSIPQSVFVFLPSCFRYIGEYYSVLTCSNIFQQKGNAGKKKWWIERLNQGHIYRNVVSEDYNHIRRMLTLIIGLPWWFRWWSICLQCGRPGFNSWVGNISWRRKWQPNPVFLPGKSHGWRNLVGCSPWGCKELETTERLHFQP